VTSARTHLVRQETWPIRGSFRIARGAKTAADVVVVEIADGRATGRGECVPYPRYEETPARVIAQIESVRSRIEAGLARDELQQLLPAGAARNALDCALLDWEAKASGRTAADLLGLPPPIAVRTTFTLSLDTPEAMAQAARVAAHSFRTLKLKIGGGDDLGRVEAVRRAAPRIRLIADANEGWSVDDLHRLTPELARLGVTLLEQPLKAGADDDLAGFLSPIPLCADESCHTRADLQRLMGRYAYVNIKLDKAGGLTEATALAREASECGFNIMVGCMVLTSLSIAPALLIARFADVVDLDGPLLLERDRVPSLTSQAKADVLYPPARELWG
jgi:L-alanine-DL-glutamate epimerase-like enolase superfamily enzyme